MTKIAVYAIAKNEAKHAERWAQSCAGADYRVVLDTGSDDDTFALLEAQGVDVFSHVLWTPKEFRFDHARNAALGLVPDDADICISLDLDEVLAEGALDLIRAAWTPGVTKLRPWINTGTWWRCDRIHARRGYRWVFPCHEVTEWTGDGVAACEIQREVEACIWHYPDDSKPRDQYLGLLELAVRENPDNARMWFYLCRQYHYADQHEACVVAADRLVELNDGWGAELAGACRLAAIAEVALGRPDAAVTWLRRGTELAPLEAEAWAALAKFHYDRQEWPECHEAAFAGARCPTANHYMTDQGARAWGLWDNAAIGAHHSGEHDVALECGYKAWRANPDDGRLQTNLHFYVVAAGIPTYAVIPKVAGERDGLTAVLVEILESQGVTALVDDSDRPIHWKWNRGIDNIAAAAERAGVDRWNVLVMNNDVQIGPGFADRIVAALRSDGARIAFPDDGTNAFTGWCFALRGEDGLHVDEQFEWWYGDTDLFHRAIADDGIGNSVPLPVAHLHPNESTAASRDLLEAARRDEGRYAAKWGLDPKSLFLAQNPTWGLATSSR